MEQLLQLPQLLERAVRLGLHRPCVLVVPVALVCHVVVVLVVLVDLVDVACRDLCLPGDVLQCLLDVQWEVVLVDALGAVEVVVAVELAQEDVLVVG